MTIQNNNYDVDYSQFYLDAKKAFEAIPEAVNNKNYAEAEQCALDAMVEINVYSEERVDTSNGIAGPHRRKKNCYRCRD
jgi:hypothetical protein